MKRLMMMLAAVLLMAGVAGTPASAVPITLDPSPTDIEGFFLQKGPADQQTAFTLTQNADVQINLLALGFGGVNFSLLACTDITCATTSAVTGTPTLNALGFASTAEFSYAALSAGTTYLINITGVIGFVLGVISAQVAATPIPGALLMFLTALGGLGFMTKRRKLVTVSGAAAA